jgi:SAM-dependent methyltransferase
MKLGPIHIVRDTTYDELVNRVRNIKRQLDEVTKGDFRLTYQRLVADLKATMSEEEAMSRAVGGAFAEVGALELALLKRFGLAPGQYVVDVGCGSGRLAKPLSQSWEGRYLGFDVVPDLVQYAERLVQRPSWTFRVAEGLRIPEPQAACADFVCFFSVLTHLRHEESFVYLQDAKRVIRPDGKIIFSFLEFAAPSHWNIFEYNLRLLTGDRIEPLNQFMSRDLIEAWARHLELEIVALHSGDEPLVPLDASGALHAFGQSVVVLRKAGGRA